MTRDRLVITGLPTPAHQALATRLGCATEAVWHLEALKADTPSLRVIAGYQAPWDALDSMLSSAGGDAAAALDEWCRYHEVLLRWRNRFPADCLLFQADRVAGRWEELAAAADQFAGTGDTHDAGPAPAAAPASARAAVCAMLLDRLAPHAIELYRALEACASLFGREPEFETAPTDTQAALDLLLAEWARSAGQDARVAQLAGALAAIEKRERQWSADASAQSAVNAKQLADLGELAKARNEQAKLAGERQVKVGELTRSVTELQVQVARLGKEREDQAQRLADLQQKLQHSERENQQTLVLLHQAQADFERHLQAGIEQERVLGDYARAVRQARVEIERLGPATTKPRRPLAP
jgi:hypothetical protein